jgi:hypothetical protein
MVLALQHEQVAHLEGLAAVADVELAVLGDRALVHAEDAHLADVGVDRDLEDMGQHMQAGSGVACMGTAAGPSPLRKSGGLASVGLGSSLTMTSSSSATPAPLRAETKHTGIRWPSRSACSSGACSSEASTSPSLR